MTDPGSSSESGPVPVRDLLKQTGEGPGRSGATPAGAAADDREPDAVGALEPEAEVGERAFRMGEETWLARPAGEGLYGTGRLGSARLAAVHFFRASEPERPVREALVSVSEFGRLDGTELSALYERATPIEMER
jgi:hypothetical protein